MTFLGQGGFSMGGGFGGIGFGLGGLVYGSGSGMRIPTSTFDIDAISPVSMLNRSFTGSIPGGFLDNYSLRNISLGLNFYNPGMQLGVPPTFGGFISGGPYALFRANAMASAQMPQDTITPLALNALAASATQRQATTTNTPAIGAAKADAADDAKARETQDDRKKLLDIADKYNAADYKDKPAGLTIKVSDEQEDGKWVIRFDGTFDRARITEKALAKFVAALQADLKDNDKVVIEVDGKKVGPKDLTAKALATALRKTPVEMRDTTTSGEPGITATTYKHPVTKAIAKEFGGDGKIADKPLIKETGLSGGNIMIEISYDPKFNKDGLTEDAVRNLVTRLPRLLNGYQDVVISINGQRFALPGSTNSAWSRSVADGHIPKNISTLTPKMYVDLMKMNQQRAAAASMPFPTILTNATGALAAILQPDNSPATKPEITPDITDNPHFTRTRTTEKS